MKITEEIALVHFIEANRDRPFEWGRCDCNTFALEAMDAAFGTGLAEKIRGHYSTPLGAVRYRRRSAWKSFIAFIEEAGFIEAKKGFEQTGDLLIVADPKWEMVHICLGNRAVSAFPDDGVRCFPMAAMADKPYRVWRRLCPR